MQYCITSNIQLNHLIYYLEFCFISLHLLHDSLQTLKTCENMKLTDLEPFPSAIQHRQQQVQSNLWQLELEKLSNAFFSYIWRYPLDKYTWEFCLGKPRKLEIMLEREELGENPSGGTNMSLVHWTGTRLLLSFSHHAVPRDHHLIINPLEENATNPWISTKQCQTSNKLQAILRLRKYCRIMVLQIYRVY